MPSLFDSLFSTVGFPVLQSTFGEPVVYRFRNGTTLTTDAIINRQPIAIANEKGDDVWTPMFTVVVAVDATLVNTGGDQIDLMEHVSGTITDVAPKTYAVKQIISQNGLNVELAIG